MQEAAGVLKTHEDWIIAKRLYRYGLLREMDLRKKSITVLEGTPDLSEFRESIKGLIRRGAVEATGAGKSTRYALAEKGKNELEAARKRALGF